MQTFDEWMAQNYPMFDLTGDREDDTTARLVRIVALHLFNQRSDLLEALKSVNDFICGVPDAPEPFGLVREAIAKATQENQNG